MLLEFTLGFWLKQGRVAHKVMFMGFLDNHPARMGKKGQPTA
jgi:hypothetical protein